MQLKVTNVENFWQAVELTVAAGHVTAATPHLPDGHSADANDMAVQYEDCDQATPGA